MSSPRSGVLGHATAISEREQSRTLPTEARAAALAAL